MILALAILLLQPQVAPPISLAAEKTKLSAPLADDAAEMILPSILIASSGSAPDSAADLNAAEQPNKPEPAAANPPAAILLLKPAKPATVSVDELRREERSRQRIWMGLGIAAHSAAAFDAWSTRRAITTAGGHELNPLLKPFGDNGSLYVAMQAGPALMDYVGRQMMHSQYGWVRRIWWVPQSASVVTSLVSGGHNLGVRPAVTSPSHQ